MIKRCSRCGKELDMDYFQVDNRAKDKRRSECRECGKKKARPAASLTDVLREYGLASLVEKLRGALSEPLTEFCGHVPREMASVIGPPEQVVETVIGEIIGRLRESFPDDSARLEADEDRRILLEQKKESDQIIRDLQMRLNGKVDR